jgi:negative regulator of flagellin synthesis FlgM
MSIHRLIGAYQQQAQVDKPDVARAQRARAMEASGANGRSSGADRVDVSFDAVLRTAAMSSAMNAPDVRQEKIDAIRQSLDNGVYVIDNHKIATRLVLEDPALFSRSGT